MFLRKEFIISYDYNIIDKKESDVIKEFKTNSGLYDSLHDYIVIYNIDLRKYTIYRVYQS